MVVAKSIHIIIEMLLQAKQRSFDKLGDELRSSRFSGVFAFTYWKYWIFSKELLFLRLHLFGKSISPPRFRVGATVGGLDGAAAGLAVPPDAFVPMDAVDAVVPPDATELA